MPRAGARSPVDVVNDAGGGWPNADVSDFAVRVAQALARNVQDVVDDVGVRELARAAGISHGTVLNVIAGRTWPDLATVARLEHACRRRLWPRPPFEHGDDGE